MAQPFVGEIRMFGGSFAPAGWFFCNGQTLQISQYDVLFALIGTTYGGNGQTTFNLPNLQGRLPVHMGTTNFGSFVQGQLAGEENHTLTLNEIPNHTHTVAAASAATVASPANAVYGGGVVSLYRSATPTTPMAPTVVGIGGGSLPHSNMMPYLCVSFIIAWAGVFPSRS
jgi:microcystin-dependent protein